MSVIDSNRFLEMWNRCTGFSDPKARDIFAQLETMYNEPGRFYHNAQHIDQCLLKLDNVDNCLSSEDKDVVELAIWFHDAIYEIGGLDNEQKSSLWFSDIARERLQSSVIEAVNRSIMFTTHKELPTDNCSKYMVDIDLSGFGQDWDGFCSDGQKIRKENNNLSEENYVSGQIKFMNKLLDRDHIYSTEYFNSRLEANARINIKRQLEIYS